MPTDSSSMPSAVHRVSRATSANTDRLTRIATGSPNAKPAPRILNGALVDGDDLAVGDEQRDAAARRHQHQGRDDRLDAADRDQHAVPQSRVRRRRPARSPIAVMTVPGLPGRRDAGDVGAGQRAADGHDRADRQIDAARGDHQGHAERDQHRGKRRCAGCRSDCRRGDRPASGWSGTLGVRMTFTASRAIKRQRRPQQRRCATILDLRRSPTPAMSSVSSLTEQSVPTSATQWPSRSTGDAVADPRHLVELCGDEHHVPCPSAGQVGDEFLDLAPWRRCRCPGRLVEDEQLRLGDQPPRQQHLLLVAAAEVLHQRVRVAGAGCRGPPGSGPPGRPWSSSTAGGRSRGGPAAPASGCRAPEARR